MLQLPYHQGRYILCNEIARGGMAVVYLAKQLGSRGCMKDVAVKRILPEWSQNRDFITMLIDEAKLLVQLQHQNIVQLFELGVDHGVYFIAMEYVAGIDLRHLLQALSTRQIQLPERFAYYITLEILKGLTFAHRQVDERSESLELVHRDISPQNILLSLHGEVKVADFGIAKGTHRRGVTVGGVKGKFAYMSPEQARGALIDPRTDIFAVGTLLYEMLVGRPLFDAPNELLILERIRQARMPSLWEQHIHPAVRAILRSALALELRDRYATAAGFLAELTRVVNDHGWHANGVEFAQYLDEILPEQVAQVQQRGRGDISPTLLQQAYESQVTRGYTSHGRAARRVSLRLGLIGVLLLMSTIVHSNVARPRARWVERTMPTAVIPTPPRVTQQIAMASPTPPAVAEMTATQFAPPASPAKIFPRLDRAGTLIVRVRPWGYVSIPGVVARRESPLQLAMDAGDYTVRVFGDRLQQVQTRARVTAAHTTICHATVVGQPKIWCR